MISTTTFIRVMRLGSLAIVVVLVAVMFLLSPADLGPFGITAWFTGLAVALTGGLTTLIIRPESKSDWNNFVNALRRGFLASIWLTSLLALGSLRQLMIRDIILLTVLVLAVDFYMRRS